MAIYKDEKVQSNGAKYYFVVPNGYRIENGKKKYLQYKSKRYKTRKECEKEQANFLLYHSSTKGSVLPINMLTEKWFNSYKPKVKIQTQEKIKRCLVFIDGYFGDMPITKINEDIYKGFRKSLEDYTYTKSNTVCHLSDAQKNRIHSYFKKVLDYSYDEYQVTYIVPKKYGNFHSIDQFPTEKKKYLELDELKKLIESTDSLQFKSLFTTLGFLGLREGEANALQIKDIDLKNNTLSITKTCSTKIFIDGKYLISTPKTKASYRTLLMPQVVRNAIVAMIDYWKHFEGYSDSWFVFGGIKPIAESTMSHKLKEALKKGELTDIHLHSLRISCASLLYNNGVQPLVVQKILGHKDLKTTMEIYTQVYAGKMQEAVSFLDNLI